MTNMQLFGNPKEECILGLDLGATFLRVARVDASGGEFFSVPTPSSMEAEEVVTSAVRNARQGMRVHYLGLSRAPGINEQGCVSGWPSRPQWAGLPLIAWLRSAAGAPAISADDGVCAALWEHRSRVYAPKNAVTACISIGTGLAVGIMAGNKPLSTGDGASTLSHQPFAPLDLPCRCGKRGCLQTALSVQGLETITAAGRISDLQEAFQAFVGSLRVRYNIDLVTITGGGVDRFGTGFLRQMLIRSAFAAGVILEVSATPSLSGIGGALLLVADQTREPGALWVERVREFIGCKNQRSQRTAVGFADPVKRVIRDVEIMQQSEREAAQHA